MTSEPSDQSDQPTGSSIESALAELEGLHDLPIAEHPAVFEAVHRVLRDQLAGTPGSPA